MGPIGYRLLPFTITTKQPGALTCWDMILDNSRSISDALTPRFTVTSMVLCRRRYITCAERSRTWEAPRWSLKGPRRAFTMSAVAPSLMSPCTSCNQCLDVAVCSARTMCARPITGWAPVRSCIKW